MSAPGREPRACVSALEGGAATRLEVRAQPGAKRSGFAGFRGGMPKIAVTAPAEDGRANAAIASEIARLFGLRASAVAPIRAGKARVKSFRLACSPSAVEAKLRELEREHDVENHQGKKSA